MSNITYSPIESDGIRKLCNLEGDDDEILCELERFACELPIPNNSNNVVETDQFRFHATETIVAQAYRVVRARCVNWTRHEEWITEIHLPVPYNILVHIDVDEYTLKTGVYDENRVTSAKKHKNIQVPKEWAKNCFEIHKLRVKANKLEEDNCTTSVKLLE